MRSLLVLLLVSLLASAVPAAAHEWPSIHEWRAMRAECQAELENARMMDKLDCAGLHAYVAQQNWLMNQQFHAEYHRPLSRVSAIASPAVPAPSPLYVPPRPR